MKRLLSDTIRVKCKSDAATNHKREEECESVNEPSRMFPRHVLLLSSNIDNRVLPLFVQTFNTNYHTSTTQLQPKRKEAINIITQTSKRSY